MSKEPTVASKEKVKFQLLLLKKKCYLFKKNLQYYYTYFIDRNDYLFSK